MLSTAMQGLIATFRYALFSVPLFTLPACWGQTNLLDPCKLLTKAEAEAILGEPVRDPQPGGIGGVKFCDYRTVKIYGGISPYSIHIAIVPEQQQTWEAGKKLHAKEMRPVTGIGEDAYFLLDDLDVFVKQRSVAINVLKDIDKPDHAKAVESAERTVAQKAIPRVQ